MRDINRKNINEYVEDMPLFIRIAIISSIILYILVIILHVSSDVITHFVQHSINPARKAISLALWPGVIGFMIAYAAVKTIYFFKLFSFGNEEPFEMDEDKPVHIKSENEMSLINSYCEVIFDQNEKRIICNEKIITKNGYYRKATVSNSKPYNINAVYQSLCSTFDSETNYDTLILAAGGLFCDIDETLVDMYGKEIETPSELITREQNQIKTKVDVNNCSKEELNALPCIDNIMADKIIKRRKNCRPFESVESFFRIMGFSDYQKTVLKGKIFAGSKHETSEQPVNNERRVDI